MDSTAEKVKDQNIESYPTIKLFRKSPYEELTFEGDRSLEDLLNYLKSNTRHPWVDVELEE